MESFICIASGSRRECVSCDASVPYEGVAEDDVNRICPAFYGARWCDLPVLTETHLTTKVISEHKVPARTIGDTGLYVHATWNNRIHNIMGDGLWSISTAQGYRVISNPDEMSEATFLKHCAPLFALTGWKDHLEMLMGDGEHKMLIYKLKEALEFI